ncbi:E3 ubiquitin-protein ligase RBBP6-like isoform X2 [Dunckerocampus dactyliophorus]|uniref:E3 ubiquitin-protein ligase RBBP6-like isoform X2 n=1 Tax=Dunckerocampus dactyliophorus TaxID=161453 RepID=UPI00240506B8|nr:E3 ubiquitin-protein ligase RBBP6-like isoform X2 [Dunckerocampus dactyliophorus]
MSHVHYKFFSRTNSVTAIFTEPLITVKELKRHIMAKERLRFSNLLISNAQTNEEYTDDDVVIPRGVSVIVKRVPGSGLMTHKNIDQSDNYASRKVKTEAPVAMKKSTGIPCSFMLQVDDPNVKGAMMTTCGHYAIPAIDAQAYAATKKAGSLGAKKEPKPEHREDPVPVELQCLICHDLLVDAAIIPCCGNSYCDDCIRTTLLESEGHICPTCNQSDVSPDTLIANKFLRQAVGHFKDKKNITRTAIRKSDSALPLAAVPAPSLGLPTPPPLNSQHQKTLNQPNAGSHCPQALFLSEAHTAFRLPSHQLACVSNSCIQAGAFSKVNQHPPYHHVPGFSGPYYQFPLPSGLLIRNPSTNGPFLANPKRVTLQVSADVQAADFVTGQDPLPPVPQSHTPPTPQFAIISHRTLPPSCCHLTINKYIPIASPKQVTQKNTWTLLPKIGRERESGLIKHAKKHMQENNQDDHPKLSSGCSLPLISIRFFLFCVESCQSRHVGIKVLKHTKSSIIREDRLSN